MAIRSKPIYRLLVYIGGLLAFILFTGGLYLAFSESYAFIEISWSDYRLSTSNPGVAIIFIGAVVIVIALALLLRTNDRLTSSGGQGGSAEVIGDGEARGGNGGNSGSFGPGGNGGNASVRGSGKATGGAGGNAQSSKYPRGGHGGSVRIVGGTGTAEGGHGGRGGYLGAGQGGNGGGGTLVGNGYIRGGDGGDAGRPCRPALGGHLECIT